MLGRHAAELKYVYIVHCPPLRRQILDGDRVVIHVAIRLVALQRLHLRADDDVLEDELDERVLVERGGVEIQLRDDDREWRV